VTSRQVTVLTEGLAQLSQLRHITLEGGLSFHRRPSLLPRLSHCFRQLFRSGVNFGSPAVATHPLFEDHTVPVVHGSGAGHEKKTHEKSKHLHVGV
jgi:hypothetical protein